MDTMPCWTLAATGLPGIFYGFPILPPDGFAGPVGLKLAHHAPGQIIHPDGVDPIPNKEDEQVIRAFLAQYMPKANGHPIEMKTCRYTYTPDEHFILDTLPGFEDRVSIAAGFSGHGFKFVSVVGEVMADLAQFGLTSQPIGFLSAQRLNGLH